MKKLLGYNYRDYIDLHIHSTSSDGTFSPNEILLEALRLGLRAVSITDHDTLEGSRIAIKSGIPDGLNFISGVEISAEPLPEFSITGSVHILGYGISVDNYELSACLARVRTSRLERVQILLNRLANLGVDISKKEVLAESTGSVIGRPHFANAMVKKGFAKSFNDAFDRFLGNGKPAFIGKKKVKISKVLALIERARGVSVLAHPYLIGIKEPSVFEKFLIKLKEMGLMGIEALYPNHSKKESMFYSKVAALHGLLITGGTDFHGTNSSGLTMGLGKGDFHVPFRLYEKLFKLVKENF